jgi:predicted TIM-barrel fold metal-dependent hydrolase
VNRFDSLVHVTRDGRWINGRGDASYARLMTELDRAGVDRACLVGLPGVVDNDYILDCARVSGGRLVPVAGVDPAIASHAHGVAAEVEALARAGFAGVKLHPRLGGYDPTDDRCLEMIRAAAREGMVVFFDTLFRQKAHATAHAADVVDRIAHECAAATIILLHGGGAALLDVAEVVRVHAALVLDLSFTVLHYAGSSVDADVRWVMERLDQRVVVGSDMPEYTPDDAFGRLERLAEGLPADKWANIACLNLQRLFPARQPVSAA